MRLLFPTEKREWETSEGCHLESCLLIKHFFAKQIRTYLPPSSSSSSSPCGAEPRSSKAGGLDIEQKQEGYLS